MAAWIESMNDEYHRPTQTQRAQHPAGSTSGILTQNVRGFRDFGANRETWMNGWKQRVEGHLVTMILLQETHVTTQAEARALETQWCRCWGRNPDAEQPLSYWSVTETRAGGVAILLHPSRLGHFALKPTQLPGRLLQLESPSELIVNVYAPNARGDREVFFATAATEIEPTGRRLWVAGDFNCVLHPHVDRITNGEWGLDVHESAALVRFCDQLDVFDCADEVHANPSLPQLSRLTYWQGSNGARLDRCYLSRQHRTWLQGSSNVTPHCQTDHCGVITWFRDPARQRLRNPLQPSLYPIPGRDAQQIDRVIGKELGHVAVAAELRGCGWEELREHVSDTLKAIKQQERRRARRQRKKADARQRKNIKTLRDLIAYVELRVARRSRSRRGTQILEKSGNSSHLFQRFVQIDQQRLIPELQRTHTHSLSDTASTADVMAAEWRPLLGQTHATVTGDAKQSACRRLYRVPEACQLTAEDNTLLMAPITDEEVLETLGTLGRHKAAGPDRLNNDFFRERGDLMVPTLTKEFNRVLEGGEMPVSFADAIIVPLPKAGDPTIATNYRPISLLQTSYKLLTKILANRVQVSLARVINEDQNGFVRGRAMANNIHLMQAILEQEYDTTSTAAVDNPAVILLDFRKAYDTLDLTFVHQALRDFGYDSRFAELVDRLHEKTRAQFLVNGDLSDPFDIVTVETLKHAIDCDPRVRGIRLRGVYTDHTHTLSAFVDDSVVFLESGQMIEALSEILQDFADVSGLQVQPQKSHAIVLNAGCVDSHLGAFPIVPVGSTVPYLGVEMGLADLAVVNWEKRCASMTKRLGTVSQYATGVSDRLQVINLACMPSLLFTARFFTPPPGAQSQIDSLWRTYVWQGTLTKQPQRAHKLASEIMHLPKRFGGLGLQDYRGATMIQAATTILSWHSRSHDKYWEAFHRLLQDRVAGNSAPVLIAYPTTTTTVSTATVRAGQDVHVIGLRAASIALRQVYKRPPALDEAQRAVAERIQMERVGFQWLTTQTGQLTVDDETGDAWRELGQLTYAQMPAELRSFWLQTPWYNHDWIRDDSGRALTRSGYGAIQIHTLAELQLRQLNRTTFTFKNPLASATIGRASTIRTLKKWLCWLIGSRAVLPDDPAGEDTSRVYSIQRHPVFDAYEWRLRDTTTALGERIVDKWTGSTSSVAAIIMSLQPWRTPVSFDTTADDAEVILDCQRLNDASIVLDGHPDLQHGPTLLKWSPHGAGGRSTATLRVIVQSALRTSDDSRHRGLTKLIGRLERQQRVNPSISEFLQTCSPQGLTRQLWGVTAQQHLCKYRLVVGGLNLRDLNGNVMPCPHGFCPEAGPSNETHLFWTCRGSTGFWRKLVRCWTGRVDSFSDNEIKAFVFASTAPPLAPHHQRALEELTDRTSLIANSVRRVWNVIVHVGVQQIWLSRNAAAFNSEQLPMIGLIATLQSAVRNHLRSLGASLQRSYSTRSQGQLVDALAVAIEDDVNDAPQTADSVRLYFDGGARQNPGPAGTGSIILQQDSAGQWQIVWWNAHFVGDTSTNNVAEHTALLRGLQECVTRYAETKQHVTVIGDSQLILRQVAGESSISAHALQALATRTQRALRSLSSYSLHHTLRTGNKMADTLANHAMDTRRTSTGPHADDGLTSLLLTLLQNDVDHPWTTSPLQNRLLPRLRHYQALENEHRPSRKRRRGEQDLLV